MTTLSQFIEKYKGKEVDVDGAYGAQCVDWFRQYVKEVLKYPQPKGVVGAADFWTNYETDPALNKFYEKIQNSPEFIPKEGDVAIWNKRMGRGFGHISICTGKGDLNNFESADQNWGNPYVELVTHTYSSFYGVLRPKGDNLSDQYKGLDLANRESMKVCVDTWTDVKDGKYVSKVEVEQMKEGWELERGVMQRQIDEERRTKIDNLEEIAIILGSPVTADMESIRANLDAQIELKQQIDDCRVGRDRLDLKIVELSDLVRLWSEECSKETGSTVKTPSGIRRALQSFLKQNQATPDISTYSAYDLLLNIFGRMKLWLKKS